MVKNLGTCDGRYLQVLPNTDRYFFLKIQVLLDTYGPLKQSENGNIWSMGGGTHRECDLAKYSILAFAARVARVNS